MSYRRELRREKRRQRREMVHTRIIPKAAWAPPDRRFGCPWCEFTDVGSTALTVTLHVHRDHPDEMAEWKLYRRVWCVANSVPA